MRISTRDFIRKHKKGIIVGTTTIVVAAVTGVIVYKRWDTIIRESKIAESVLGNAKPLTTDTSEILEAAEVCNIEQSFEEKIINIDRYVRNLPDSWNASPEKIEQAKELGIELTEHQTLVNPHTRRSA